MARLEISKKELIVEIHAMERELSTATVLFHQVVAEKAGLSGADHKYLDLVIRHGPMTAGKMAELSGLTTGAVTGVIDRLENEGLVKREKDPGDRRKVLIVPQRQKAMQQVGKHFETTLIELGKLYERFSLSELQTIRKYLQTTGQFFESRLNEVR